MHVKLNVVSIMFKLTAMRNEKEYSFDLFWLTIKKVHLKAIDLNDIYCKHYLLEGYYSLQVNEDGFGWTLFPTKTASSFFHFIMNVVKANGGSLLM